MIEETALTADTSTIDETLADYERDGQPDGHPAGDVEPGPLDVLCQRLTLLLPGHTHFQRTKPDGGPQIGILLLGLGGGQRFTSGGPSTPGFRARWTTPEGLWQVSALLCPAGSGAALFHAKVKGPSVKLLRTDQTIDQFEEMLRVVGAFG